MTAKMTGKPPNTNKSLARLLAVQALFEMEATRRHYQDITAEILSQDRPMLLDIEVDEKLPADEKLTKQIISDTVYHQAKIDQTVNQVLREGWPLKAIDPTMRAIFRAATAELIRGRAPYKVVINEYLDITRAFDEDKASISFVNAVLDNTRKSLEDES